MGRCFVWRERELELLYDWRFTANQFVWEPSPLRLTTSTSFFNWKIWGYSPYVTSSLTRGLVYRLQFLLVLASTAILGSESRATHDHTVPDSRLPQPGGPGPRIYIPQEQGGPVIPPGTGFPFRRLVQLAGLWWRYSTPPPHGFHLVWRIYLWLKEVMMHFYKRPDVTLKLIVDALIIMVTTRSRCFRVKTSLFAMELIYFVLYDSHKRYN
jgi:hypothetical protein